MEGEEGVGGGSGRRRDQEEAHVIDRVHLQLNSELQPTLTVNTHAYTGDTILSHSWSEKD